MGLACAGGACSDSAGPGRAPLGIVVDAPGPEVVVGAVGAEGWVTIRGRVTGSADLERLVHSVDGQAEQAVEVRPASGGEGTFELVVRGLALGAHEVRLRGYSRRGGAPDGSSVTIHVVQAVREIPLPEPAGHAFPAAINGHGDVTGYWTDLEQPTWHAFLSRNGQTHRLSGPGDWRSAAPGLNERGDVVGYVVADPDAHLQQAILWRGGTAQTFLAHPGAGTAINDDGVITGSINIDAGWPRAFVSRGGAVTVIGDPGRISAGYDVNARGDVVGTSHGPDGDSFAFVHSGGTTTRLGSLGGIQTTGHAINDAGEVVGYSEVPDRTAFQAFITRNGQIRALLAARPSVVTSYAFDINNRGVAVGEMVEIANGQAYHTGFLCVGSSVVSLDEVLAYTGYAIVAAYSVSDRGEIAAVAVSSSAPGWLRPVIIALPGGPEAGAAVAETRLAPGPAIMHAASVARHLDEYRARRAPTIEGQRMKD